MRNDSVTTTTHHEDPAKLLETFNAKSVCGSMAEYNAHVRRLRPVHQLFIESAVDMLSRPLTSSELKASIVAQRIGANYGLCELDKNDPVVLQAEIEQCHQEISTIMNEPGTSPEAAGYFCEKMAEITSTQAHVINEVLKGVATDSLIDLVANQPKDPQEPHASKGYLMAKEVLAQKETAMREEIAHAQTPWTPYTSSSDTVKKTAFLKNGIKCAMLKAELQQAHDAEMTQVLDDFAPVMTHGNYTLPLAVTKNSLGTMITMVNEVTETTSAKNLVTAVGRWIAGTPRKTQPN